ncbi:MAG: DUF4326 domain-containing protein [Methylococcaceae bacterium]|nr:DUF4326 domain-containing protein [Methylococcaceae bacterium]
MNIQETPTVFIAYPHDFLCYEKFERKITKILSNLNKFSLAYRDDYLGYIEKKLGADKRVLDAITLPDNKKNFDGINYAIIFNDSESFSNIITDLSTKKIPTRLIDTKITRVVNVDKKEKYDVYIGRGSDWGNPYPIGIEGNRDEVIRKYQYDFDRGYLKSSKEQLLKLRGRTLGCHCKPAACHGDVLANYLNSLDDGE